MTHLSPTLPKDSDANGLNGLNRALIADPEQEHLIVAWIDCKSVTTDTDTGSSEATARILRVEAVNTADVDDATTMLRHALEKRTGKTVLPFDTDTGEVL